MLKELFKLMMTIKVIKENEIEISHKKTTKI